MKSDFRKGVVGLAALLVAVMPAFAIYVAVTDLGTLGADRSWATSINAAGQITGVLYSTSSRSLFFWDNGTMTDIGTLDGSYPAYTSRGINSTGQVVGYSQHHSCPRHQMSLS